MKSTEPSTKAIAKQEKRVAIEISPTEKNGFPIVGIGASTGGIEALRQFLKAVPKHAGMAFVVIQHSGDGRKSMLPEVLQRSTAMSAEARIIQPKKKEPIQPTDSKYSSNRQSGIE